ncbi:MAG: hypothetical protein PVG71_02160 [Anaerolineae bacterium]
MSDSVVYRSKVCIERVEGPLRPAYLPAEQRPVLFGAHSEIAEHCRLDSEAFEPHAVTLNYFVAATAGSLTGTLGGAPEARSIPAGEGRLTAETVGEIEEEDAVLIVRHIHVAHNLRVASHQRDAATRAHENHIAHCPMARPIRDCVEVTTSLEMESPWQAARS